MPAKKAVNLNIDAALLAEARAENVRLSAVAEQALRAEIANIRAERWRRENAKAIEAWNRELEDKGLWSDGLRLF